MQGPRSFHTAEEPHEHFEVVDTVISDKLELAAGSGEAQKVHYMKIPVSGSWKSVALDLFSEAIQTFPGVAGVTFIWGIGRVIPGLEGNEYQFDISQTRTIDWNGFNAGQRMNTNDALDIPANLEGLQDRFVIIRVIYKTLTALPTVQSVTYTTRIGALVFSPNPIDEVPGWEPADTDESPGVQPPFDWIPVVVVGGLVIGGLVGVGYFLDRTVAFKRELAMGPLV